MIDIPASSRRHADKFGVPTLDDPFGSRGRRHVHDSTTSPPTSACHTVSVVEDQAPRFEPIGKLGLDLLRLLPRAAAGDHVVGLCRLPGYAAWSAGCLVVLGRPTRRRGVGQRGPRDHPGPNVTVRQNAAIPYRWLARRAELVELSLVTRDTDPEPLVQQFLQITANSAAHLTSAGHGT